MSVRYFLDTNVLVYTFDWQAPAKRLRARELVREALDSGRGCISWQVVQEFLNVALHRFATPMSHSEADAYLSTVLLPLCRATPTLELYRNALSIQLETQFRFYDSLVVAGAVACQSGVLYSEDLQNGRSVRGVRIVNPF